VTSWYCQSWQWRQLARRQPLWRQRSYVSHNGIVMTSDIEWRQSVWRRHMTSFIVTSIVVVRISSKCRFMMTSVSMTSFIPALFIVTSACDTVVLSVVIVTSVSTTTTFVTSSHVSRRDVRQHDVSQCDGHCVMKSRRHWWNELQIASSNYFPVRYHCPLDNPICLQPSTAEFFFFLFYLWRCHYLVQLRFSCAFCHCFYDRTFLNIQFQRVILWICTHLGIDAPRPITTNSRPSGNI